MYSDPSSSLSRVCEGGGASLDRRAELHACIYNPLVVAVELSERRGDRRRDAALQDLLL